MDFGAVPDGVTVNTEAIQRAIDLCEKDAGVYIPKGVFVTGALFLKSNLTIFLEKGSKLLGSDRLEDFPIMGYSFEGKNQLCYASLLNTGDAFYENITIEGEGVIDANGEKLFALEMQENKGKRGRAVCIRNTKNLFLKNITIRQSPAWCLHLLYCRNVFINSIKVHTKYKENGDLYQGIFNGDGMDIDSCKNVMIVDSFIASQDDCIAIKSGRDEEGRRTGIASENIVIENCTFKSGFGVAIGSEMSGGVQDIYVKNCVFENVFSIGSIKAVRGRGGYIKNIHYENCSLKNYSMEFNDTKWFRGALYLDGFYGKEEFNIDELEEISEKTPIVDGIYLKNLTIDTKAGNAIYLCGLPERPFRNVYLENIKAHGKYGMKVSNIENFYQDKVSVSAQEGETVTMHKVIEKS